MTLLIQDIPDEDYKFTSAILSSASVYWSPFWIILSKAAGGTTDPFILDWLMWLSIPNVYAACVKPDKTKLLNMTKSILNAPVILDSLIMTITKSFILLQHHTIPMITVIKTDNAVNGIPVKDRLLVMQHHKAFPMSHKTHIECTQEATSLTYCNQYIWHSCSWAQSRTNVKTCRMECNVSWQFTLISDM